MFRVVVYSLTSFSSTVIECNVYVYNPIVYDDLLYMRWFTVCAVNRAGLRKSLPFSISK